MQIWKSLLPFTSPLNSWHLEDSPHPTPQALSSRMSIDLTAGMSSPGSDHCVRAELGKKDQELVLDIVYRASDFQLGMGLEPKGNSPSHPHIQAYKKRLVLFRGETILPSLDLSPRQLFFRSYAQVSRRHLPLGLNPRQINTLPSLALPSKKKEEKKKNFIPKFLLEMRPTFVFSHFF